MIDFPDSPYEFFPPKPNPIVWSCAVQFNRCFGLPRRHKITKIEVHGAEKIRPMIQAGARILFLPNHSTHSDPQLMIELQRRLGIRSCFMATYDLFQQTKFRAWIMTRCGAFSVDRDGSDRKSVQTAIKVLTEGDYALTIFSEGNVYFTNDRPMPFMEGASFISMKAQKTLGEDQSIYVVPVSIKATHLKDQRPVLLKKLEDLATELGESYHPDTPVDELHRIGAAALKNRLKDHVPTLPSRAGKDIPKLLEESTEGVVKDLENRMALHPKSEEPLLQRIRKIRAAIHKIRTDETEHPEAEAWAEKAMLALRLLSYRGNYVREHPSLDRFAESLEKILEDYHATFQAPFAPRKVLFRLNEPINLAERLPAFSENSRGTMQQLTGDCEAAVLAGMNHLNAINQSSGGKIMLP